MNVWLAAENVAFLIQDTLRQFRFKTGSNVVSFG